MHRVDAVYCCRYRSSVVCVCYVTDALCINGQTDREADGERM